MTAAEGDSDGGQRSPLNAARSVVVVLFVALALRLLVLTGIVGLPLWSTPDVDAAVYQRTAERVAGGDLLLGHDVLRMSPGYFYFLGAVFAVFGAGPLGFRLVQLALGLGTVLLGWDAARRMFGLRVALAVGVVLGAYEPLAFYENVQLGETLGSLLMTTWVWLAVRCGAEDQPLGLRVSLAFGFLWGLLCTVRPNALVLGLPLVYLLWSKRAPDSAVKRAGRIAGALLAAGLAIAPITVRNYLATSELVPLVGHAGLNLYLGNAHGATGTFRVPDEVPHARGPQEQFSAFHKAAEAALGRTLSPAEADAYWKRRTLQEVRDDPLDWLAIMLKKARLFWNGREVSDVYDYNFLRKASPELGVPAPQFVIVAPFALLGTFVLLMRRERVARFVALVILAYAGSIVLVFVSARYRLPLVPILMLAWAACFVDLWSVVTSRDPRAIAARLLPLAAALAIAWPVGLKHDVGDQESYFRLGLAFEREQMFIEAKDAYLAALREDASHVQSRIRLARLYEHADERALALSEWKKLLRAAGDPDSPDARAARAKVEQLSRAARHR